MFTIYLQKGNKPVTQHMDIKASGTSLFDGISALYNSGANGAWSCNQNFQEAKIFVNGKYIGTHRNGDLIQL